jgi:hypothetical protein
VAELQHRRVAPTAGPGSMIIRNRLENSNKITSIRRMGRQPARTATPAAQVWNARAILHICDGLL